MNGTERARAGLKLTVVLCGLLALASRPVRAALPGEFEPIEREGARIAPDLIFVRMRPVTAASIFAFFPFPLATLSSVSR